MKDEKTPVTAFRADHAMLKRIEDFARDNGLSRGAAVRAIIDKGLNAK